VSLWIGAVVGALLGWMSRGPIVYYSVPADQPGRSVCPHCGRSLARSGRAGAVQILSPTGRCPGCRDRIGPGPGRVEAVMAVVLGLVAWRFPGDLALWWVAAVGVLLGFIDVAAHRLPNVFTYGMFVGLVALLALPGDWVRLGWAVLNGLGLAAFYLLLILIYPAGMGLGDAKLALSIGTALGWYGWIVTVYGGAVGFLLAGVFSAVLLVLGRVTRKSQIPHGPFMLLGALVTVLVLPVG
jgi:leader peptidase (prepilin peptidase) / N-methyltransferase